MLPESGEHHASGKPNVPFPYEIYCVGGLTRSLMAAQPKLMSVKTGGDILLLLLIADHTAHTDRILSGPTNEVWLNPWLTHLTTRLGVRYHHRHATRLECGPNTRRVTAAIVKGMLEHRRRSAGERVCTAPTAQADEYLRPSYHGLRAKDKTFSANLHTGLPLVNGVEAKLSRVLLNLFNNAFCTVYQRHQGTDFIITLPY